MDPRVLRRALTGKWPQGLRDFLVGYYRWSCRVYASPRFLLTDEFPPFRLS